MNKKELRKNYRAEYFIDERGEEKVKYVYVGGTYELTAPDNYLVFKVLFVIFAVVDLAAYIVPLCFECGLFRQIYVVAPYVMRVFSIAYLLWAAYRALRLSSPYKERGKKTIFDYSRVAAVAGEILSVAALIGSAVYLIKHGAEGMDYLAIAGSVAGAAFDFAIYLNIARCKLNRIERQEEDNAPSVEEEKEESPDGTPEE